MEPEQRMDAEQRAEAERRATEKREALQALTEKLAKQALAEGATSVVVSVSGASEPVATVGATAGQSQFWCRHVGPELERYGLLRATRDYIDKLVLTFSAMGDSKGVKLGVVDRDVLLQSVYPGSPVAPMRPSFSGGRFEPWPGQVVVDVSGSYGAGGGLGPAATTAVGGSGQAQGEGGGAGGGKAER